MSLQLQVYWLQGQGQMLARYCFLTGHSCWGLVDLEQRSALGW